MSEDEIIQYIEEHFDEVYKECMEDCNGDEEIFIFQYMIKKFKKEMEQEKEKNKELELQLKNSDIERLRDYIKYKIECFENIMNGRLGDGARPDYQRKIDLLNEVLEESY